MIREWQEPGDVVPRPPVEVHATVGAWHPTICCNTWNHRLPAGDVTTFRREFVTCGRSGVARLRAVWRRRWYTFELSVIAYVENHPRRVLWALAVAAFAFGAATSGWAVLS